MEITISDLRKITDKLFQLLEEKNIKTIELDVDYYWNISKEELYDIDNEPKKLNVGQLTDDWKELKNMVNSDKSSIVYYFVWLSAILRYIGEKIVA